MMGRRRRRKRKDHLDAVDAHRDRDNAVAKARRRRSRPVAPRHLEAGADTRRLSGDRRVARAALRRAGGNPDRAAAALRCLACDVRDRAVFAKATGQPADALHRRAERAERAALLLERGDVVDHRPGSAR